MGLLSSLFGGSKSSATSSNQAYGFLAPALQPAVQGGVNAMGMLGDELAGGFDQFKKNAGFDFQLGEGLKGVTGAGAAGSLLRSGSTARGIADYATGLNSSMYGNWLDRIGQMGQLGLGAAGALTSAGQQSTSTGKQKGGILPALFG